MTKTFEQLRATILEVAAAEKITKSGLSSLSRDILEQLVEDEDVRAINMLLGQDDSGAFVLTPINWRTAAMFFSHFLPFTSNYEAEVKAYAEQGKGERVPLVFKKKSKRKWSEKTAEISAFLANDRNDIWSWSATNVKMEKKVVDYKQELIRSVTKALDESKGDMTVADVLDAITSVDGMSIGAILESIQGQPEVAE